MSTSIDTIPYWIQSAPLPRFAKLDRNIQADVVIVGGGITGMTAAYLFAKAGRSVALLERERLSQIDTGHTSAHLTMVTDQRLTDLVSSFGRDHARAVWDAGLAALAQIDTAIREEDIDCNFAWVAGYLYGATERTGSGADEKVLEREASVAAELGFDASTLDDVPLVGGPGIVFEQQARFHPRKYLAGLARVAAVHGAQFYEHTAAEEFSEKPLSVKANGHTISCDSIVLATHTPLVGNTSIARASLFQTKLALYTSYVVAGSVEKGTVPDALFWDTADPYHYLRIDPHRDHDLVIFGGEDHKTGQIDNTRDCYARLEAALRSLVPGIKISHHWSGQVIETPDGLPYIGETADHQFAATGFSGNGMTFGTLGAMMACDRVLGRKNPWAELFDTDRTNLKVGVWDYIRENKDYPYYLLRDRFAGAETRTLRAVKRGEGKIVDIDGTKTAVSRDRAGSLTMRSAVCTHMGCLVDWNTAERTWDCPCHGSRFKPTGEVIAGPAEAPLSEASPKPSR